MSCPFRVLLVGWTMNVQPLLSSRILDLLPVNGWQIVLESLGLHVLLSGVRGEFRYEILADIVRQVLSEQGAIIPFIELQRVESIPKTAAGKPPLITSNLTRSLSLSYALDSGVSEIEALKRGDSIKTT